MTNQRDHSLHDSNCGQAYPSSDRCMPPQAALLLPVHVKLPDMDRWKASICEEFLRVDRILWAQGKRFCMKTSADNLGQCAKEAYAAVLRADMITSENQVDILELLNASRKLLSAATLRRWLTAHKKRKAASPLSE